MQPIPPSNRRIWFLTALLTGAFVRLIHPLQSKFPLNDGGLFYTLINDLLAASGRLPWFTSYNHASIPYAYPPLAFYLTAALHTLTRIPLLALIRLLPPLLACLTIPAFHALAKRLLPPPAALYAVFAFTLLPTAFDPLIVGAGLTRGLGLLFALLTLAQFHHLLNAPSRRALALTTICAALTALSHPGMAWFAAYSGLVLLFFHRRNADALKNAALAASGALVLTTPWWVTLLVRHGLQPLLSPYQTESFSPTALLTPFTLLFTNEPLVDFLAVFLFIGFIRALQRGERLLPLWLLNIFLFEPRLGAAYAAVPAALLAGVGAETLATALGAKSRRSTGLALGFVFLYTLVGAYLAPTYHALDEGEAQAMHWVKANTPQQATFVVFTGQPAYGTDYVGEWFPAFSGRSSLATPQGTEWLPGREFNQRAALHAALQACRDLACLQAWAQAHTIKPAYLYISIKALAENHRPFALPETTPLFQNDAAIIYAWPGE